jgi:hypothetical protein
VPASPSLSLLLLLRYGRGHGRDLVGLALFLTGTLMNPQSEEAEILDFPLNNPEKSGRLVIWYNGTRGTSTAN